MTQDEIIRMAREAEFWKGTNGLWMCDYQDLERFATLVAAHEREKKAEQEPVGHVLSDGTICWDKWCPDAGTLLYAAPVRTKELTEAEIATLVQRNTIDGKIMPFALCEAVNACINAIKSRSK